MLLFVFQTIDLLFLPDPAAHRKNVPIPRARGDVPHSWNTPPALGCRIRRAFPSPPGCGRSSNFRWPCCSFEIGAIHNPADCTFRHKGECHPSSPALPPEYTSPLPLSRTWKSRPCCLTVQTYPLRWKPPDTGFSQAPAARSAFRALPLQRG